MPKKGQKRAKKGKKMQKEEVLNFEQEAAKLKREQAKKIKIESKIKNLQLKKLNGELVPVRDVEKKFYNFALLVKSRIEQIPGQLAQYVDSGVVEVVKKEIFYALKEISEKGNDNGK